MKCSVKSSRLERIFEISGSFTALDEERFFDVFISIKSMPESTLVFDFRNCSAIDPSAMGMLLLAAEEAARRGISKRIQNISKQIKTPLLMAKLNTIYDFE